jgi:hypothetical protein
MQWLSRPPVQGLPTPSSALRIGTRTRRTRLAPHRTNNRTHTHTQRARLHPSSPLLLLLEHPLAHRHHFGHLHHRSRSLVNATSRTKSVPPASTWSYKTRNGHLSHSSSRTHSSRTAAPDPHPHPHPHPRVTLSEAAPSYECVTDSETASDMPRVKRKAPFSPDGRPPKQHRLSLNNGRHSPGDNTPDGPLEKPGFLSGDESDTADPSHLAVMLEVPQESPEWQETIQNVVPTVVSIRFCQPCSFDTEFAETSEATGFVVDAERGYVCLLAYLLASPSHASGTDSAVLLQVHSYQSACCRRRPFLGILRLRQPRRSRCLPRLSRSYPRLRYLTLRS